jgi:uncharacterized protein YjeT (DUF2065 family)
VFTWKIIVAAIGLVLIIEGAVYFAVPDVSRKLLQSVLESKAHVIRWIGLGCIILGLAVLWSASSI